MTRLNTRLNPYDDDRILVSGLIDEDAEAWRAFHELYGALVERTIASVMRRFWRLLAPVDAHDARAGFYASLLANDKRKLRSFDPGRGLRFSAWIKVLAVRSTLDFVRRARRRPPSSDLDEALDIPCGKADPHAHAVRKEERAVVTDLIQ